MAKRAIKPSQQVFLIMTDVERRASLANELRVAGLEVEEYQTAREFQIDKPRRTGGMVFADVRLMSGSTTLLDDLKADKAFPILLMAGAAEVPRAVKKGVDFLLTPVTASDLIASISQTNESVPYDESELRWGFERLTALRRQCTDSGRRSTKRSGRSPLFKLLLQSKVDIVLTLVGTYPGITRC